MNILKTFFQQENFVGNFQFLTIIAEECTLEMWVNLPFLCPLTDVSYVGAKRRETLFIPSSPSPLITVICTITQRLRIPSLFQSPLNMIMRLRGTQSHSYTTIFPFCATSPLSPFKIQECWLIIMEQAGRGGPVDRRKRAGNEDQAPTMSNCFY